MRTIQAQAHGAPEVLELVERETPTPDRGQVCIDVAAAGLNFADVEKRRGRYPDGPQPPYTPGIEVSGRVVATGPETSVETGDTVAAFVDGGGYAERVLAHEETVFEVPDAVSTPAAAGMPVQFLTAHNALVEWGGLEAGENVLVNAAAGGVGTAAVQIASARSDVTVIGTASTAEKRDLAASLGADDTIDYTEASVADRLAELTDGDGIDLVLDGVGGEAFYEALDALASCGRIVSYGMASGTVPSVSLPRLLFENQSVLGYHLGHALETQPERVKEAVPKLHSLFESGDAAVHVGDRYPLSEAGTAHSALQNRESTGKLLLIP
ncbi:MULTISPECIES: NADPH:quinone oxidoreductase family protein [Haloarcula]|uniref:Alcohol dehydrogenase n=1 Tax=Haloarcula pellucida TaxID=1427151 RepID=A0A830GNI7_9EURY|nr:MULTISPECIES: NADPH:quinone oxidoreductase family protein [Halomicroarcula]MBX0349938.1 NADPH:quinone oxidoreductase family protein [Halomicroarcula pellucida]MDS0279686.1 NADPH:quinone oxidoreductase family protein [Halomicroarcula sp. S1AR25-4]GGN95082.1 alcohol dehydrogenase [Halomicroarcula pellucida]